MKKPYLDNVGRRYGRLVAIARETGSLKTPSGFLGAIAVQSIGHQLRMSLANNIPFVRAGGRRRLTSGESIDLSVTERVLELDFGR